MRIMVTGPLHSGKSTLVRNVIGRLGWTAPAGWVSRREELEPGQPVVTLSTWDGATRQVVARWSGPTAAPGAPPFTPDAAAWDRYALQHLRDLPPGQPVVLDELGLLEWPAAACVAAVAGLFDRAAPLLAVVQERALDSWLRRVGAARVDRIARLSADQRGQLADELVAAWQPPRP